MEIPREIDDATMKHFTIQRLVTRCNQCGIEGTKRCNRCKTVYYCSRDCQRLDWTDHSEACSRLKGEKKQDACSSFWGIDNLRLIAMDEKTEVKNHRILVCGFHFGLMGELGDLEVSEGDGGIAMVIYDIYSSDYLTSSEIMSDLSENVEKSVDAFKTEALDTQDAKKYVRGDAFFVSLSSEDDIMYSACLVRCPVNGGSEDRYRIFQSMQPHYGLKEWLDSPDKFTFGGTKKASDVSEYAECLRLAMSESEAYRKLTGVKGIEISGLRFYFRHTTFTLSAVYKNSDQ